MSAPLTPTPASSSRLAAPSDDAAPVEFRQDGTVLHVCLSNPTQKNALRPGMSLAIARRLDMAACDPTCRAVLLYGSGGVFSSGGDVRAIAHQQGRPPAEQIERLAAVNELIRSMRRCSKPIVAAVEGHAAGAGCSLALAADFVVAATTSAFTVAHVKLGISPDGGVTLALARALPSQLANEVLMLGRPIDAARLHQAGIVNRLAAPGQAVVEGQRLALEIAAGALHAMGRIKKLVNQVAWSGLDEQLEAERIAFTASLFGDEAKEGVIAFLQKRAADFGVYRGRQVTVSARSYSY